MKGVKRVFTYLMVASLLLAGIAAPVSAGKGGVHGEWKRPIRILCEGDRVSVPAPGAKLHQR
jgi:hypothetical protein